MNRDDQASGARPLTGRQFLFILLGAFAVILTANLTLAFSALNTFPGLEVRNSYIASRGFDERRAAQEALGWSVAVRYERGVFGLQVSDAEGRAADNIAEIDVVVGRPTHEREDRRPELERVAETYAAPMDLAPGAWSVRVNATASDGTAFQQRLSLHVR